ncbi:MAG TPA: hypothetical protein VFV70_10255 [Hyphomonadaceae bacterium]|nr:hypothetical protein [Hyphomonadaceae bacterium]
MQTFGKTMRSSASAIGLGLLTAFGLASVVAVSAPAAVAQVKAKKEFVENFNAAQEAMKAGNHQLALEKAAAALPHAADNQQKSAVEQVRVASYVGLKKWPEAIKSIEAAQALGVPDSLQKIYLQQLAAAYAESGNEAKALELTKTFIDQYGGDSTQLAYLARKGLDAKNYDEATSYANKAIDQLQKEGKPANATYYNILLNAQSAGGKMDEYYATLQRVAPILNKEVYWRPLIMRAKNETKYRKDDALLDVYRTLEAAGVKLTTDEQLDMGELALNRGMAVESERVLSPLMQAGVTGPDAERSKRLFTKAQQDAKADKAGGLEQSEKDAAGKPTGEVYAVTGESYMSAGNYSKGIELMQKGLEKGQLEPGDEQLIKLRLGIAQYKAGQKDAARKTWSEVTGDNGSAWLAKIWTSLSQV